MDYNDLIYLRSLTIFKNFRFEEVLQSPLFCKIGCFGAGEVVVANSNESDWIYIVKSGSLSVLGRLQNVKPKKQKKVKSTTSIRPEAAIPFRKRRRRRSIVFGSRTPSMVLPTFKTKMEMDLKMAATVPGYFGTFDRLGILDYDIIKKNTMSRLERKPSNRISNLIPMLDVAKMKKKEEDEGWVTEEEEEGKRRTKLPDISPTKKTTFFSPPEITQQTKQPQSSNVKLPIMSDNKSDLGLRNKSKSQIRDGFARRRQDLDLKMPRNDPAKQRGADVFILVQIIEAGQHFGLTDMVFHDQPNLSLVSNGAECYLIAKSFYRLNAHQDFMYDLQKTETPFPSWEDLQMSFRSKVNWRSHSQDTYQDLVKSSSQRRMMRKQHRVVAGVYNHRAGPI